MGVGSVLGRVTGGEDLFNLDREEGLSIDKTLQNKHLTIKFLLAIHNYYGICLVPPCFKPPNSNLFVKVSWRKKNIER